VSDDPHAPTTAGPVPPSEQAPDTASGDGVAAKASQATGQAKEKAAEVTGQAQEKLTQVSGQAQEKLTQVSGQAQQVTSERPEILVGAAFAGGFLSAMILKRLGR
jgi:uncharacterized protein YjbJ (UPF0337 family)